MQGSRYEDCSGAQRGHVLISRTSVLVPAAIPESYRRSIPRLPSRPPGQAAPPPATSDQRICRSSSAACSSPISIARQSRTGHSAMRAMVSARLRSGLSVDSWRCIDQQALVCERRDILLSAVSATRPLRTSSPGMSRAPTSSGGGATPARSIHVTSQVACTDFTANLQRLALSLWSRRQVSYSLSDPGGIKVVRLHLHSQTRCHQASFFLGRGWRRPSLESISPTAASHPDRNVSSSFYFGRGPRQPLLVSTFPTAVPTGRCKPTLLSSGLEVGDDLR